MYCTSCGHIGKSKKKTPGSFFTELLLWMLLIVPGLIYSIWRLTARKKVCVNCGHPTVIPEGSPLAKKNLDSSNPDHGSLSVPSAAKKPRTIFDAPAPPPPCRKCPFCAERIHPDAVFCKHCKKDIPAVEKPKTECTMCGEVFRDEGAVCKKCGFDRIDNVMTGGAEA